MLSKVTAESLTDPVQKPPLKFTSSVIVVVITICVAADQMVTSAQSQCGKKALELLQPNFEKGI